MRIVICDDEQQCADSLCTLIRDYCGQRQLEAEISVYTDPVLFRSSDLTRIDVAFLDANMGKINGIEAARALREANKTAILVYVSAFVEYAPMGYEVDAFRYLMKNNLENTFEDNMDEITGRLELKNRQLTVAVAGGSIQVTIHQLLFLESFRHQILFHLSDGAVLESRRFTLTELSEILKPHHFLRIHKSFLVNPEHVVAIKNKTATLDNGQTLSCGKLDYARTLQSFMLWKGGL